MSSRRVIVRSAVGGDPAKEDPEAIVEGTAQKLGVVPGAGEPNLLAMHSPREHVAHGLERPPGDLPRNRRDDVPLARDDQLGEGCGGKKVEWNGGLSGRRLPRGRQRSHAVLLAELRDRRPFEAEGREEVGSQLLRWLVIRLGVPPLDTPRGRTVAVALSIDKEEAKLVSELALLDERLPARAEPAWTRTTASPSPSAKTWRSVSIGPRV